MEFILVILLCSSANAAEMRPYSLSPAAGDTRYVNITGDTMTGTLGGTQLNLSGQSTVAGTMTVTGSAFSVGGSGFVVANGSASVGVGVDTAAKLSVGSLTSFDSIFRVKSGNQYGEFSTNDATEQVDIKNSGSYGIAGTSAIRFFTAVSAGGTDASTPKVVISKAGNLGVGTTTPSDKLEVNGSITATTGTFSGANFSVGGSTLVVSGGLVGVNTSSPLVPLQVGVYTQASGNRPATGSNSMALTLSNLDSDATVGGQLWLHDNGTIAADHGGRIVFSANGNTNLSAVVASLQGARENATSGNYSGYLSFITRGASTAERMRITSTGNVGIGTAAPLSKLEVNGDITTASTLTVQGANFSVGGSTLVVSGGKVGIGTTTPLSKLDVVGDITASTTMTVVGNSFSVGGSSFAVSAGRTSIGGSWGGTAGMLEIKPINAIDSIYIRPADSPNIGSSLSMFSAGTINKFLIYVPYGDTTQIGTFTNNSGLGINTNSTERIHINLNGEVGIGSTTPVAQLSVNTNGMNSQTGYSLLISSTSGGNTFGIHPDGHLSFYGAVSTFGVCANAGLTLSRDGAMQITFTGANSSCAVVFGSAFDANPVCTLGASVTTIAEQPTFTAKSSTGFTVIPLTGAWESGDEIDVICVGSH